MLEARLLAKKPLYEEKVTTFFVTKMVSPLTATGTRCRFINIEFL